MINKLRSAKGDPIFEDRHLQISTNSLRALLDAGIFPPHLISVYQESQSHFSHRVEYGVDNFTPIALCKCLLFNYPLEASAIPATWEVRQTLRQRIWHSKGHSLVSFARSFAVLGQPQHPHLHPLHSVKLHATFDNVKAARYAGLIFVRHLPPCAPYRPHNKSLPPDLPT